MDSGGVDSGGTQRSSAASTRACCRAAYSANVIFFRPASCFVRPVRLCLDFVALADQHLNARLSLFQLLAATLAQLHSFFEQLERALQRQLAALHLLDDQFELLESGLEAGRWFLFSGHCFILAFARVRTRHARVLPHYTTEERLISGSDRAPHCFIVSSNSPRRISITFSTPACPNADNPQMEGRPMPTPFSPSASPFLGFVPRAMA